MASLPILRWRALDDSGDPISGAKLNFYEAGTATPLDTYSDEALSSANANPVVADGDGWFGEIYMKTDQAYKVTYTDASDVSIWEVDNINAGALMSNTFETRIAQASIFECYAKHEIGSQLAMMSLILDNCAETISWPTRGLVPRCQSSGCADGRTTSNCV